MKKAGKGESVLTAFQIQAARLNKLEYRRLQNNVNIMHDDLQIYLSRLQRQAQGIRHHYTNVVRVIKPNPAYQLWKQVHAYEIAQDEAQILIESEKLKQKLKSKTREQVPLTNKISSEPVRPLLVLLDDNVENPIEPMVDLSKHFLRPKTSPVKKHLPDQHFKNPLLTMLNEQSINSNNQIRSQQSEYGANSFLPPIRPPSSRKSEQGKLITATNTQQTSNIDALYRIALQNLTAYKSVEKTRVEKRKLLDKEFATQHRALRGTARSAGHRQIHVTNK